MSVIFKTFFYQNFNGGGSTDSLDVFVELLAPVDRSAKSPEIAKELQAEIQTKFGDLALAQEAGARPASRTAIR